MKKQRNSQFQKLIEKCNDLICLFIKNIDHHNNKFAKLAGSSPYTRLMGLHQPIGMQLLIMPVLWTLVVACSNIFQFLLFSFVFIIITVAVRGVASTINYIIDRNFDKEIEKTKNSPIASGELSVTQAIKFLVLLLGAVLALLLFLPIQATCFGVLTIGLVATYPFIRRYSHFPQIFLVFTFNLGIFIAWFAINEYFSFLPALIYLASIFWTIGYDTIYTYQDREDDIKIGIQPMTLMFGDKSKEVIKYSYRISIFLLGITGLNANLNLIFFLSLGLGLWQLNKQIEQIENVNMDSPKNYQNQFKDNLNYGLLILSAFIIGSF